jgi:murein DD-endopeptidase MepM/ murein hydrolase activator NlpD
MNGTAVAALLIVTAQTSGAGLEITHRARALVPGEVVVVDVRGPAALQKVEGRWLERAVAFYSIDATHWQGLLPIDLAARAGRRTLSVTAIGADGRTLSREHAITIAAKTFPTRRISVEEKFAEPPPEELARIEREWRIVEAIFASPPRERQWNDSFVAPVPGKATSSFGRRSIVNGEPRSPHTGADFQAATGTPVVSPNRGRVALAADLYFAGRTIVIDHGAGVYSYLAHLSEIKVAEGDTVQRGQTLGLSGATGRVTGPHLHWTLRLGAARIDPLSLLSVLGEDGTLRKTGDAGRGHRARLTRLAAGARDLHVRRAAVRRELQPVHVGVPRERLEARRFLVARVVERDDEIRMAGHLRARVVGTLGFLEPAETPRLRQELPELRFAQLRAQKVAGVGVNQIVLPRLQALVKSADGPRFDALLTRARGCAHE